MKAHDQEASLTWTGERFLPDIDGNIELEHVHRYIFASELVQGKKVLDIACGEGYGSHLLAETAEHVFGVDISEEAIHYAKNKYRKLNLEFKVGSCSKIPLPDHSIDVVVSFETIEHHNEHIEMMLEIRRVLHSDGILILSSPDKQEYSDATGYNNPFHFKELYKHELEALLNTYFINTTFLGQRLIFGSNIVSSAVTYSGEINHISKHEGMNKPLYFITVSSNAKLPNTFNSFFEGAHGTLKEKNEMISNLSVIEYEKNQKFHELTMALQNAAWLVEEKNQQINYITRSLGEKNHLLKDMTLLEEELDRKELILNNLNHTLFEIYSSNSWRMCEPLRVAGRIFRKYILNKKGSILLKKAYHVYKIAGFEGVKNATFNFIQKKFSKPKPVNNAAANELALFNQLFNQARHNQSDYVPFSSNAKIKTDIKFIAFYLPQFHPIPENDEAWGKGFTEWTNVSKALPQFIGHYQPHLPDELGFYDLRVMDIQKRQIELAKNYGIYGFCYHHYWFGGKKLLSQPFQTVLKNKELDLPFCLCWANENWTRKWDGRDDEVIIKQIHSEEDDIAFIKDIEPALRDKRYIRVNGKPLLIIYKIFLLPNPTETAKRWRKYCQEVGIGPLHIAVAQTFNPTLSIPPEFDSLVEFPPHYSTVGESLLNPQLSLVNPNYNGSVFDYNLLIEKALKVKKSKLPLFRTVLPSWDNEARKPGCGHTFINANPTLYKKWLENSISYTREHHNENLIFINAWNEWAEGAHLEPDRKYGYAWLQATYDALQETCYSKFQQKLILVSHDAHPYGAQCLALKLVKTLVSDFNIKVDLVLLGPGSFTSEFSRWAKVHNLSGLDPQGKEAVTLARQLVMKGHTKAIVNTTVSGLFLETLRNAGLDCMALIHELSGTIKKLNIQNSAQIIAKRANSIVFPATQVADSFNALVSFKAPIQKIRPQGLIKKNILSNQKAFARIELRKRLNLDGNAQIILGMGYGDHRKGVDLFIEMGLIVLKTHRQAHFVWVGHFEKVMEECISTRLLKEDKRNHFHLVDYIHDTDVFFAGADVFALTSREDPFPSVVLHSLESAVPVVGFIGAGGFTDLLKNGCGILVPKEDIKAYAKTIGDLLDDVLEREVLGKKGAKLIENDYSFHHYVYDLLNWVDIPTKRLSVIVPNYNYAQFLEERLNSIFKQNYPIYEIIILDDASTDNSTSVIEKCLSHIDIPYKIIVNTENSGSVFRQWKKGVAKASGDFIWIAEADDFAEPGFVEHVIKSFEDNDVVVSYSQSRQMDEQGQILSNNYFDYTDDIHSEKWKQDYICDGLEELANAMAIKNTIPNVSGAIFRKIHLQNALSYSQKELSQLKIAGDWLIYSEILKHGKIAYCYKSLNSHRRHQNSVTHSSSSNEKHLMEISYMQKHVATLTTLTPDVIEKANAYLIKIKNLFGLKELPC